MSGRHALGLLVAMTLASASPASPVLRWEGHETKLLVGEPAVLHVMLDDTIRVRTIDLTVAFDPGIIASVSGEPGALFDGLDLYADFAAESDSSWNGYAVVLGADSWAEGPGELFRWTVEPVGEGASALTTVALGLRPPGGGDYPEVSLSDAAVDVGDITFSPSVPEIVARLAVQPNPFNPRTTIVIEPRAPGDARLLIFDARGRLVARPWQGSLDPTPLRIGWDGRDLDGRPLASGTYVIRLIDDRGNTAASRATLLR